MYPPTWTYELDVLKLIHPIPSYHETVCPRQLVFQTTLLFIRYVLLQALKKQKLIFVFNSRNDILGIPHPVEQLLAKSSLFVLS